MILSATDVHLMCTSFHWVCFSARSVHWHRLIPVMRTALLCRVQRFAVAEVMFTKMCNCYFGGEDIERLEVAVLHPLPALCHPSARGRCGRNKWLLGKALLHSNWHRNRGVGVCHARLSVLCGGVCRTRILSIFSQRR